MPINYDRYPPDWKERAKRIKDRDNWTCQQCSAKHEERGAHDDTGHWWPTEKIKEDPALVRLVFGVDSIMDLPMKKIIVTVAHLDHDETNWLVSDDRLQTMCAACHLKYDARDNQERRAYGKNYRDNQLTLF